jgi:hypothetical protein
MYLRTICFLLLFALINRPAAASPLADSVSIEGRWDITVDLNGRPAPSWLEVRHSGSRSLVGEFVSLSGSARPIAKITYNGRQLRFAIPPQWESGSGDLVLEGEVRENALEGTITYPDGKTAAWKGVRAPLLRRSKPPVWGAPARLFNGRDLTGWRAIGENQWMVKNGILTSPKSGANLATEAKFIDFKLHIEFRYPKGSNSGVYLRGRHEVQIEDSRGTGPWPGGFGAVYGFIAPSEQVAKAPGEWQAYDITLVGRMLTVVANGKTIICNREIPGITGGALDSNEGEAGPFYLQGDHGPVEYRNIIVTPAK